MNVWAICMLVISMFCLWDALLEAQDGDSKRKQFYIRFIEAWMMFDILLIGLNTLFICIILLP